MATVTFIKYRKQSAGALRGVVRYVSQKDKTMEANGQPLISGQNCTAQLAAEEFLATRQAHRKNSTIWFYHYVQSFHPQEPVTGEQAHKIAREFAARAWPDNEVLIATHIDAGHIHSHFIVNAVCCESGKMLRQGPGTLQHLRPISDELCREHGLPVLKRQRKKQAHGMTSREYRSACKGQSWKFQLINTIDLCMGRAKTKKEFIEEMEKQGCQVRWEEQWKSITYTSPDGKKCRDNKLHDKKYLKERMEREFRIRAEILAGRIEAAESAAGDKLPNHTGSGVRSPDSRAMGGTAEPSGGAVQFTGTAERNAGGNTIHNAGPDHADREAGENGGRDKQSAPTGWEAERAACFSDGTQRMDHPAVRAGGDRGLRSVGDDLVRLGRSLESDPGDIPLMPQTHTDRKTLIREREKKIAMGHKADDHEEKQAWQQTM